MSSNFSNQTTILRRRQNLSHLKKMLTKTEKTQVDLIEQIKSEENDIKVLSNLGKDGGVSH